MNLYPQPNGKLMPDLLKDAQTRFSRMPIRDVATEWAWHCQRVSELQVQSEEANPPDWEPDTYLTLLELQKFEQSLADTAYQIIDMRYRSSLLPLGDEIIAIDPDLVRRIKESINLVTLMQTHGTILVKRGKEFVGKCMFHEDKNGSLHVNPGYGLFKCYGCNAGGVNSIWNLWRRSGWRRRLLISNCQIYTQGFQMRCSRWFLPWSKHEKIEQIQ